MYSDKSKHPVGDLLRNDNWKKIYHLIKNKNLQGHMPPITFQTHPSDEDIDIYDGNKLIHLAAINTNKYCDKILTHIADTDPNILMISNDHGDSVYHLLAKYRRFDLLKKIIKNENIFYLINESGDTVLTVSSINNDFLNWVISNFGPDFDIANNDGMTVLLNCIDNDNYENVKLLLTTDISMTFPPSMPPLNYAVKNKKNKIAKMLLKKITDINTVDEDSMTPLLYSIINDMPDIFDILIKKNPDLTYNGFNGEKNYLVYALHYNEDFVDKLLENGMDANLYSKQLNTPLHKILQAAKIKNGEILCPVKQSTVAKLIYYTDLNKQNINGDTCMHLLVETGIIWNHDKILENKDIDIFIKNIDGKTPFDHLKGTDKNDILLLVAKNYMKKLGKKDMINISNNRIDCLKKYNSEKCLSFVQKYILETGSSLPAKIDKKYINSSLDTIIESNKINSGKFNADTLHNMIYMIELLNIYKNIGIPFQMYIRDKYMTDKMMQNWGDLYRNYDNDDNSGSVIVDLVKIYTDHFYEILPYLIIWKNNDMYYMNKHLDYYMGKCFALDKIRFIMMKLTFVVSESNTHANIIIYDKKQKILERFEPYGGAVSFINQTEIDSFIETKILSIINKYNSGSIYLSPNKLFKGIGFQMISDDGNVYVKKLGDPSGYCLAWTFWYLEKRVLNPDINPVDLIAFYINKIGSSDKNKSDKTFINYIRKYSKRLDDMKNNFLKEANIAEEDYYNLVLPTESLNKIVFLLVTKFNKICRFYAVKN